LQFNNIIGKIIKNIPNFYGNIKLCKKGTFQNIKIKIETIIINGKEYTYTWSDINMMIERDGALYLEAIDPINSGRTYTETEEKIIEDSLNETELKALAFDIVEGVSE
jgi:hypothetical protein